MSKSVLIRCHKRMIVVDAFNDHRVWITRDQEQPFRLFSVAARLGDDTVTIAGFCL